MRVELGLKPFLYTAPIYIALGEGFFAEEGLDVRVHMISGHAATSLLMVDHGEIDVMIGGVFLGLFNAIDEGSAVRMVADVANFAPMLAAHGTGRGTEPRRQRTAPVHRPRCAAYGST